MWILNTATTMMPLPAAPAIINQIIKTEDKKFQTGLLLGIVFASSIGGSATLVGTITILASIILFLIPSKKDEGVLLKWDYFKKLTIGVIFLFGSGFALSKGMKIIQYITHFAIMIVLVIFMISLTEFTSNSASATLMIPIVYEVIKSMDTPSLYFLIPLTTAAFFAFMFPVATPPNTLVFATEKIAIKVMVRKGIWLNLIGIVFISLVYNWLVMNIF